MKMLEPMKRWAVTYNGDMVHQTTGQKFNVTLEVFLMFHLIGKPHRLNNYNMIDDMI